MSSTLYTRVLKNVKVRVPGALDDMIKLELFNAVNEFMTSSGVWKEDIELALEVGETEYDIASETTNSAIISRLYLVKDAVSFVPVKATMAVPGTLVLVTEPSTAQDVIVTLILTTWEPVDRDGWPYAPEWFVDRYYMGLVDGVVGKLMAQPAKPYSNEKLSVFHMRKFSAAIAQARSDELHGNLHNAQKWRFPAFAGSRNTHSRS